MTLINGLLTSFDDLVISPKLELILHKCCLAYLVDYKGFEKEIKELSNYSLVHIINSHICTITLLGYNYIIHKNIRHKLEVIIPIRLDNIDIRI